jgi:hypothetical protein
VSRRNRVATASSSLLPLRSWIPGRSTTA